MNDDIVDVRTEYLSNVFHPSKFIEKCKIAISQIREFKIKNEFDAIAFRGVSGAAFSFVLSYELQIPLICVRKSDQETAHSCEKVEGLYSAKKYIIVDDFVCTGSTIVQIEQEISDAYLKYWYGNKGIIPKCVGIYLYSQIVSHFDGFFFQSKDEKRKYNIPYIPNVRM